MSRKYVYIRDANGKIIGRTFDTGQQGSQKFVSLEGAKKTPSPEPSPGRKEQKLPALGLMLKWLQEDIVSAFFQYSRTRSLTGIAVAALALVLALFALFSGGIFFLLNFLSGLLFLGLGISLFLRKQTLTMWMFVLLTGLSLLNLPSFILQFFLPYGMFIFRFFACVLLDGASFLLLAMVAKTGFGRGKSSFLWAIPTVLQVLRCICSVTLFSMVQTLFVYLAASWMVTPYQENGI